MNVSSRWAGVGVAVIAGTILAWFLSLRLQRTAPEFALLLQTGSTDFFAWLGSWLIPWVQTPGFGGIAAVVAAVIAFSAARHQAETQRQAQRKEQWWKRAEWALNLTISEKSQDRTVGFQMLESLSTSEYAAEHEGDVLAAATAWSLENAEQYLDSFDETGDNGHTEGGDDDK
jgi:hypothetical protein